MTTILTPVLGLVCWTLVVWFWMYATRLPALARANIPPAAAKHPGSLDVLPSHVRAVADNYNHLLEQPVIFYALIFYVDVGKTETFLNIHLAWAYVLLRVLHSIVQCTINLVPLRFALFTLSTACLGVIAVEQCLVVLARQ